MKAFNVFKAHSGEAAFTVTALLLALLITALIAAGTWAFSEFTLQSSRYSTYHALQRDAGKADSLSATYANLLRDMEAIRQALPPQNQSSNVLNTLGDAARRMDLGIGGITALDEIPFSDYTELPFELALTGTFPNLVRYLHELETQGMVLRVRRLNVQNESLNKSHLTAKLELSVFAPKHGRAHAAPDTTTQSNSHAAAPNTEAAVP